MYAVAWPSIDAHFVGSDVCVCVAGSKCVNERNTTSRWQTFYIHLLLLWSLWRAIRNACTARIFIAHSVYYFVYANAVDSARVTPTDWNGGRVIWAIMACVFFFVSSNGQTVAGISGRTSKIDWIPFFEWMIKLNRFSASGRNCDCDWTKRKIEIAIWTLTNFSSHHRLNNKTNDIIIQLNFLFCMWRSVSCSHVKRIRSVLWPIVIVRQSHTHRNTQYVSDSLIVFFLSFARRQTIKSEAHW